MNEKIHETFDLIHASDDLKQNTLAYLNKKTHGFHSVHSFPIKKLMVVVTCLVIWFLGVQEYKAYYTPTTFISVDINPSFEIALNCYDKVIGVSGYNEDGMILSKQLDIKHLHYKEAIDELFLNEKIQSYLLADEEMSMTLVEMNRKNQDEILAFLNQHAAKHQNVSCHQGDKALVDKAHEVGLSFGKYQVYLEMLTLQENISVDEVKEMSMKEMHQFIENCKRDNNHHVNSHHDQKGS